MEQPLAQQGKDLPKEDCQWPRSVVIIASPSANLNSIYIALKRIQAGSANRFALKLSTDPEEILDAERVIFPGVGHASFILAKLRQSGLDEVLRRIQNPMIGICLGMQLFFEELSEGGTQAGLGLLPGKILSLRAMQSPVQTNASSPYKLSVPPVPHMGWNSIEPYSGQEAIYHSLAGNEPIQKACYFVHSYYHPTSPLTLAKCHYGEIEISAIVRGQGNSRHIWGCQFHPEKSGLLGERLLRQWLCLPSGT